MIEMRWRRAEFDDKTAVKVLHEKGNCLSTMMILQYREVIHGRPSEEFIDGVWTETSGEITTDWIDVPIHEEQGE